MKTTKEKLEIRVSQIKSDIMRFSEQLQKAVSKNDFNGIKHCSKIINEKCSQLEEIQWLVELESL